MTYMDIDGRCPNRTRPSLPETTNMTLTTPLRKILALALATAVLGAGMAASADASSPPASAGGSSLALAKWHDG